MEINKVASWEDVIADNYNAEAPQQDQNEQAVVADLDGSVNTDGTIVSDETNGDKVVEDQDNNPLLDINSPEVGNDANLPDVTLDNPVDHGDPGSSVSEDTQSTTENIESEFNLTESDEQALYEYLTIKNTDYSQVSDMDIITGYLESEHQNWDDEDIQFELEQKYGSALFMDKRNLDEIDQDLDPDEYKEAIKLNKEIDRAQKLLKRDAMEKRVELEDIKSNIKLPLSAIKKTEDNVKRDAEEALQPQGPTQEEIEKYQKDWVDAVEKEIPTLDEFKFKLGDEDVSYKITDEEKQQMVETMKSFNGENYLVQRGWVNQDGSPNVKRIAEDVYILENNEKMFKSGWTQAKEKAKMDLIGKDLKNIDLNSPVNTFDAKGGDPYDFGNYVLSL